MAGLTIDYILYRFKMYEDNHIMKKIIGIILAIISCAVAISVFVGIMKFAKYSDNVSWRVPSKTQVYVYLLQRKHDPCKRISIVSIPANKREREPARDVYTFKSKKRDMVFHIISTLDNVSTIGGTTAVYKQVIYDDYKISENNQMSDDLWFKYRYNQDYNSLLLKLPVKDENRAREYVRENYGISPGEIVYLDNSPSLDFKDKCVNEANTEYITKLSDSTAAVYVSDVHVTSEDNRFEPYIFYKEMSIGNDEIFLNAEIRDYKVSGKGNEDYYIGIVFISAGDKSRELKGDFR